jgi:hypothetical protein
MSEYTEPEFDGEMDDEQEDPRISMAEDAANEPMDDNWGW